MNRLNLIKQLFRFGVVGGVSTLLNSAIFLILVDSLEVQPLLGNLIAFLCAFLVSYFGHSSWTFQDNQHSKERISKFLVISLMGLLINSGFVWILMHVLAYSAYIAILPMIFLTPPLVFVINKAWVFKSSPAT